MNISPTPHLDVNEILNLLFTNIKEILQDQLVGVYLYGSLTNGGFDEHSDIDVIFVTRNDIPDEIFSTLSAMHKEIAKMDSLWSNQLEVAYIPKVAFERFDRSILYPHLDRGSGESLHKIAPESDWLILCHNLRDLGITILGPNPKTFIDSVSSSDLRQAVMEGVPIWFAPIIANPSEIKKRGYQSFFVLSICRMLYTLKHGEIISKPAAAQWGKEQLDKQWEPLIERAWLGRQTPDLETNPEDINGTLDMMHYIMNHIEQIR